ncbi:Serine/threonine-protein kinase srk2j, partial [Turnera subulata]
MRNKETNELVAIERVYKIDENMAREGDHHRSLRHPNIRYSNFKVVSLERI